LSAQGARGPRGADYIQYVMSPIARTSAALPVMYKMRVALSELPSPAWVTAFRLAMQATPVDEPTTTVVGNEISFACVPEHVGEIDAHIDHWIAVANGTLISTAVRQAEVLQAE
jgi:hypothetical protein